MPAFNGFTPATIKFLKDLKKNNTKEWFADNKNSYEELVREPALDFITAMSKPILKVSTKFEAIPKKVGGSLMRVYRDVRFSADKTPYKTNIGIQFRHVAGKDVHAPGFYFHIEPGECFVGAGVWHPASDPLYKIRSYIAEHPEKWRKIVNSKKLSSEFELVGDSLTRPPRGFDKEHPEIEHIKRKDFIVLAAIEEEQLFSAELVKDVAALYKKTGDFVSLLCDALDQPF